MITKWMLVKMSDDEIAAREHKRLQSIFEEVFVKLGAPKEAAMFGDHDFGEDGHRFYFSPKAGEMIPLRGYDTTPCAPPKRGSAALIIGDIDAWDMLPPGVSADM